MSTALALVEEQDAAAAPEGAAPEAARKKRGKDKRSATKGPPEVATPDGAAPAPPKADALKKAASGGKGKPADAPPAVTPTKPLPVGAVGKAARQEMTELLVAADLELMRPALKEGGVLSASSSSLPMTAAGWPCLAPRAWSIERPGPDWPTGLIARAKCQS